MRYFALVDCNSFYCSCERVFRPDTRNRPIIVLSNNDGCAISFCSRAKELGFKMGGAYYKLKDLIKEHNVAVFSSNYALYDNMSKRVMSILQEFTPSLEIYSVDEAFLEFEGYDHYDFFQYAKNIRDTVLQRTGIPVGVGISTTKVLSKIANRVAKKNKNVCVMTTTQEIDAILKVFPIKDVWGIGTKSAAKLAELRIHTAYDFKMYPNEAVIQKLLTKVGRQIQDEIRGISCIEMGEVEDKKNTGTSRSFGIPVFDKKELKEALAHFATHASFKLRNQNSVCYSISAFIHTNPFKDTPQYYGESRVQFSTGTSDTIKLIRAAHDILEEIYRPGFEYKKGGVMLNHVVPAGQNQIDLFNSQPDDNGKLNKVMDLINDKYGAHTIKSAACGLDYTWKTIADYKSQRYTTSWNELLKVKA